jgi:hypothetical protein
VEYGCQVVSEIYPSCGCDLAELGMRSIAERLERFAVNANVATVLGSITASSDTVESKEWKMKQC